MEDFRQTIKDHGWSQGSIFSEDAHPEIQSLIDTAIKAGDFCIVINQSCDLLCRSLDQEPTTEILIANKVEKLDGNFIKAKNPRALHLNLEIEGKVVAVAISIKNRYFIPRQLLIRYSPNKKIKIEEPRILIRWMVARYDRLALPDEFDKRIKIKEKEILALHKGLAELDHLLIALNSWEDLKTTEGYRVGLLGIIDSKHNTPQLRIKMEKELNRLKDMLNGCPGVQVTQVELLADTVATLSVFKKYNKWYLEPISLRDPDNHEQFDYKI